MVKIIHLSKPSLDYDMTLKLFSFENLFKIAVSVLSFYLPGALFLKLISIRNGAENQKLNTIDVLTFSVLTQIICNWIISNICLFEGIRDSSPTGIMWKISFYILFAGLAGFILGTLFEKTELISRLQRSFFGYSSSGIIQTIIDKRKATNVYFVLKRKPDLLFYGWLGPYDDKTPCAQVSIIVKGCKPIKKGNWVKYKKIENELKNPYNYTTFNYMIVDPKETDYFVIQKDAPNKISRKK